MIIESSQNKIVKYLNSLKLRKEREKHNVFLAEGIKFVNEIPSDWKVEMYAVSQSYAEENNMELLENCNVHIFSNEIFKSFSDTETPQGIAAVCYQKKYEEDIIFKSNIKSGFYLIAEELNDPGNLGTIIRTADACGVSGVFLTKGSVDLYNNKVLRSTMGSVFHVPVIQNVDAKQIITKMKSINIKVFAAHLKGNMYHFDLDLKQPCGLIIGNEARGISEEVSQMCDCRVKIPMPGNAESLNASVAAGVLMYEVVRQRTN